MTFHDRTDAGRRLARLLLDRQDLTRDAVVLGLPRGGVPVAREVALALGAPLDVLIVRKLGAPIQPELAMGAVAEGGARFIDHRIVDHVGCDDDELNAIVRREEQEIARRVALWRGGRAPLDVVGRTVLVVDDGIATGATLRAALRALKTRRPARIVVAVPVASSSAIESLRAEVDDFVCVVVDDAMWSIGGSYRDFTQVSDRHVSEILDEAQRTNAAAAGQRAAP